MSIRVSANQSIRLLTTRQPLLKRGFAVSPAADSQTNNPGKVTTPEPRTSNTPYLLAGLAVAIVGGYYLFSNPEPPKSPAVKNVEKAMKPKTDKVEKDSAGK